MRQIVLLIALGCSLVFVHCGSTKSAARHRFIISLIKSWQFDYSSHVDQNATPSYKSQRVRIGQMKGELQFPELLFTHLKNKYNVPVTKDASEAEGHMLLEAVTFASGGFAFVDVALVDTKGLVLARTRIWNVDERNVVIHDDDFPDFAAEKIADLFESK
jgi:hypothetical protein